MTTLEKAQEFLIKNGPGPRTIWIPMDAPLLAAFGAQISSEKDLEIARLREALEKAVSYLNAIKGPHIGGEGVMAREVRIKAEAALSKEKAK